MYQFRVPTLFILLLYMYVICIMVLLLTSISIILLLLILWWGKTIIGETEAFSLYQGKSDYSYNVSIPLTTRQHEHLNMCGPHATCSTTGDQCTADNDCNMIEAYSTNSQYSVYNENAKVPQYFKGVNIWKRQFDIGNRIFRERQNSNNKTNTNKPNYPSVRTLSGEFIDNGPPAFISNGQL